TKAVVLVSPSNPTGAIFNRAELIRLAEVIEKHNLLLLVDDPYSAFTYENRERYFCLASLPEIADQLVYLFTFSKCYAMSGWRLGYMVLPEWLNRQLIKVHDATMICAPRISQVAGVAALSGSQDHLAEFEQVLSVRRQLICERLDCMAHLFSYSKPDGAYYVFPRIVADHKDSWEFSLRLLQQARVTVTPGSAFGPAGEHHLRMAYCVEEDTINLAFDRLEALFPGS
ncbi:MAG TPA: aminotransferase, partial [Gammaproteobacteria bacterium]|nr:aminotransferase [Gammaproteobacteria bacterium]